MGWDLKLPGLPGNESVSADAMLTHVDPRDVGQVMENQVLHDDALTRQGEKGEPDGLDIHGEAKVAAL